MKAIRDRLDRATELLRRQERSKDHCDKSIAERALECLLRDALGDLRFVLDHASTPAEERAFWDATAAACMASPDYDSAEEAGRAADEMLKERRKRFGGGE